MLPPRAWPAGHLDARQWERILARALIIGGREDMLAVRVRASRHRELFLTGLSGDGYGEKREEMVQTIPREHMPEDVELKVGMQLQAQTPEGEAQLVTIVGLTNTDVTLDGNHPLAGVALNFAVEVVEVRQATEEELSHGHVHGPGGHEH